MWLSLYDTSGIHLSEKQGFGVLLAGYHDATLSNIHIPLIEDYLFSYKATTICF